jgi:signal transduction histidine kinase
MCAPGNPVTRSQALPEFILSWRIAARECRKIFAPFFTTKKDVGTGLGLWIVKGLLLKTGGSIRCRSRVATPETAPSGSGTVMMIFIPSESE